MDPLSQPYQDYTALRQSYVPPQHRTDKLANAIFRPSTYAVLEGLSAGGNRQNMLSTGVSSYTSWHAFRAVNRLVNKGIAVVGERFPAVGNFMDAHPVLTAIPAMAVGITAGSVAQSRVRRFTRQIMNGVVDNPHPGSAVIDKALYNRPMNGLARLTEPIGRVLKTPIARAGLSLGFVGLAGITIFNYFKDLSAVGRHNRDVQAFERELFSPQGDQFTLQNRLAGRNVIDVESRAVNL